MIDEQPIIPDNHLFEDVHLGEEAKKFLKHTPVGRHLAERAVFEYKQAVVDFEDLSIATILENPEKVVAIKQKMNLSRAFILWVNDMLVSADRAEEELHNRDMSDITID